MSSYLVDNITVIIVDNNLNYRKGLRTIISFENIASVIGEASDGAEFLDLLMQQKPDLVLMDIEMPRMNGIEATQKALELFPDLKIIVLSMYDDEEYFNIMIRLGVKGYILKTGSIEELENAINEVAMGNIFISDIIQRKLAKKQIPGGL